MLTSVKELRALVKERGFKVSARKVTAGKKVQQFLPRDALQKMLATGVQAKPPASWSGGTSPGTPPRVKVAKKTIVKKTASKTAKTSKDARKRNTSKAAESMRKKLAKLVPGYESSGRTLDQLQRDLNAHFAVRLNSGRVVDARKVAKNLKWVPGGAWSAWNHGTFLTDRSDGSSYTPYENTYLTPYNIEGIHDLTGRYPIAGERQNLYWDERAYDTKRRLRRLHSQVPLPDGLGSSLPRY
jgi:hypothetical protein